MLFISKTYRIPSAHAYEYILNCDIWHWKDETGVFQFVLVAPPPPRSKMAFTYVVNVYSGMLLSKGHLGSREEHLKIN